MICQKDLVIKKLTELADNIRIEIVEMIWKAGSGHLGGSLSLAEIMSVLYFHHLRIDPVNPQWEDRDRLVLSKGHAAPVLYASLAERGFFPKKHLSTLRKTGSILQGHPDMKRTPGVDMTTGCLGEGLSAGIGIALGSVIAKKNYWTFVIISDGELQEGQTWEAAMFAYAKKVPRLVAILDSNGCMCDDFIDDVIPIEPIIKKWESFGWIVKEIDGHNIEQILDTLEDIKCREISPVLIKANTCKGKGVCFMENNPKWHGQTMNHEEYYAAICELKEVIKVEKE